MCSLQSDACQPKMLSAPNKRIIKPPANYYLGIRTASFEIEYTGFTLEQEAAFDMAADIWASIVVSDVPITIKANYIGMPGLGGITLPNMKKNFSSAPEIEKWYVSALANSLAGYDLAPDEMDMDIHIGMDDWYYGLDGACPATKADFVSLCLHEICHGLGFVGVAKVSGSLGSFGEITAADFGISTSFPFLSMEGKSSVFDTYLRNNADQFLCDTIIFPNNSPELKIAMTTNDVYFDGANAQFVDPIKKVRIHAPTSFLLGTSMVHLNEVSYSAADTNTLMTPYYEYGVVTHAPGFITTAVLQDIGWTLNATYTSINQNDIDLTYTYVNNIFRVLSDIDVMEINVYTINGQQVLSNKNTNHIDLSNIEEKVIIVHIKSKTSKWDAVKLVHH